MIDSNNEYCSISVNLLKLIDLSNLYFQSDDLLVSWDIDGDGQYDDASGEIVQWIWYNPVNNFPIKLKLTDYKDLTDTDSRTINVIKSGVWIRPTAYYDP